MSMYGIPQQLNLDEINVYKEDTNKQYFVLDGLNYPLSYGKHFFTISYRDPDENNIHRGLKLVEDSTILFE